jgi:hypothetical protein
LVFKTTGTVQNKVSDFYQRENCFLHFWKCNVIYKIEAPLQMLLQEKTTGYTFSEKRYLGCISEGIQYQLILCKIFVCSCRAVPTLQMKGRWEFNVNVWSPFMYYQKWNYYFQNRIKMFCLPVPTLIFLW